MGLRTTASPPSDVTENAQSAVGFVRGNPQLFVGPCGRAGSSQSRGLSRGGCHSVLGVPSVTNERFNEWFIAAAEEDRITRNTKGTVEMLCVYEAGNLARIGLDAGGGLK